jgi:hypothetical protein
MTTYDTYGMIKKHFIHDAELQQLMRSCSTDMPCGSSTSKLGLAASASHTAATGVVHRSSKQEPTGPGRASSMQLSVTAAPPEKDAANSGLRACQLDESTDNSSKRASRMRCRCSAAVVR